MTALISEKQIVLRKPKLLTYDDYAKLTPPDSGNYEKNTFMNQRAFKNTGIFCLKNKQLRSTKTLEVN